MELISCFVIALAAFLFGYALGLDHAEADAAQRKDGDQ
jgi:hypothetical protein